jgi:hypothetical protein
MAGKQAFLSLLGALIFGIAIPDGAHADIVFRNFEDPDAQKWVEEEVEPPAFPQEANLREFYVSELTTNKFYIDASTLSVGKDGVVRYVLVVRTSGGATNITFEGVRCSSRELRIYASGRRDGVWAKARLSEWRPIENKLKNRHHAELSRNLFCPNGTPMRSAAEGREALRLGKHPEVN